MVSTGNRTWEWFEWEGPDVLVRRMTSGAARRQGFPGDLRQEYRFLHEATGRLREALGPCVGRVFLPEGEPAELPAEEAGRCVVEFIGRAGANRLAALWSPALGWLEAIRLPAL